MCPPFLPQDFSTKMLELAEPPEGCDSVRGVRNTEDDPSPFQVSCFAVVAREWAGTTSQTKLSGRGGGQ